MVHLVSLLRNKELPGERVYHEAYAKSKIGVVFWIITERCNLKCIHCYRNAGIEGQEGPPIEKAHQIIEKINALGRTLIFVSGGEPLIYPYIFDILGELKRNRHRVILSTNGTLINEEVAKKLQDIGVDYVAIPMYGEEEFHDYITGVKGSYRKVVNAISLLRDSNVNLGLKVTVMKSTLPHIDYIFDFAVKNNVKLLYLCDFLPKGRGTNLSKEIPTKEDWRDLLIRLTRKVLDKGYDIELDIGLHPSAGVYVLRELGAEKILDSLAKSHRRFASEGRGSVTISPNGDVSISEFLTNIKIGNILQNTWEEILSHPLYRAVGDSSNLKGKCGQCPYKHVCGGSRVKAYYYKGDLLEEDPTCLIN
jgi:radical SAM protein with 4Fe4S-binding SPASM domain